MALFGALEQELRLDKSQFSKELSEAEREMESVDDQAQSTGRGFSSMGEKMQQAGMGLSLGVTAPLGLVGAKSLQAASDVEEMQSKMSVVFGEQTKQIKQWAAEQEKATGISELQWQEYATTLADTFKPMGFAQKEASNMSKEVTSLAVDLASFNNMPTTEALDRLRGGLVGNHENLERFGVMITQSTLDKKLQKMFGKGADAATEQEKALARLQIVQEGTTDAQGDAARTSDSFANSLRALKGTAREAAAQFGQALMPAVKPLVSLLKQGVTWFSNLSKEAKTMVAAGAAVAAAIGPLLVVIGTLITLPISGPMIAAAAAIGAVAAAAIAFRDKLRPVVNALIPKLKKVINAIIPVVKSAARQFLNILIPAVKQTVGTILSLWQQFGPRITSIINKFIKIWQTIFQVFLGALIKIWKKHGDGVMNVLTILKDLVVGAIRGIASVVLPIIDWFLGIALKFWRQHGDTIKRLLVRMSDVIATTLTVLGQTIHKIVKFISNTWTNTIKPLIATTKQTFNQIVTAIKGPLIFIRDKVISPIINWISKQWRKHGDKIMSEARKTWNAIKNAVNGAMKFVQNKVIRPILNWINGFWSDHGTELKKGTNQTFNAIKKAIDVAMGAIKTAIKTVLNALGTFWNKWGDDILTAVKFAFDAIKGAIETAIDWMATAITAVLKLIRGDWEGAWNTIKDFLKRTLDKILGFIEKWNLVGVVKDAANAAVDALKNLGGQFYDAGVGLLTSFIDGIKSKVDDAKNAATGAVGSIRDVLPFSDAKEGPLSDLTASGEALPATLAKGMEQNLRPLKDSSTSVAHAANPALSGSANPRGGGGTTIEIYVDGSKSPTETARAIERRLGQAGVSAWRS